MHPGLRLLRDANWIEALHKPKDCDKMPRMANGPASAAALCGKVLVDCCESSKEWREYMRTLPAMGIALVLGLASPGVLFAEEKPAAEAEKAAGASYAIKVGGL